MKWSKFTEKQVTFALPQAEVGAPVEEFRQETEFRSPRSTTGEK
jgi:hypothetical protein